MMGHGQDAQNRCGVYFRLAGANRESLVSKIGEVSRPMIGGFAACYAGWLGLPETSPERSTSSSPRRRRSLRRGEDESHSGGSARKGEALPHSGAAEPQRSAVLDSSDREYPKHFTPRRKTPRARKEPSSLLRVFAP